MYMTFSLGLGYVGKVRKDRVSRTVRRVQSCYRRCVQRRMVLDQREKKAKSSVIRW
nr:MAG TPA: hypothetical protein [Caudoviricetes sp.]